MSDSLGPFLKRVESIMTRLSHEELKHRLLSHARGLSAAHRAAFLEILAVSPAPAKSSSGLLDEIDAFVSELKGGVYFEGWGWDRDYGGERALGDESWAPAMDALFTEAARAFLAQDWSLAASAFGRLLKALALEEAFSGSEYPEDMLETDLSEARTRYLRAAYEAAPSSERARALLDAIHDLGPEAWRAVNLAAMGEACEAPMSDLALFLPAWVTVLEGVRLEPSYMDCDRIRALAEAGFMAEGVQGLARLAREQGDRHPVLYKRWLDELLRVDRRDDALAVAREGAERVIDGVDAATLADRLAGIARAMGRSDIEEYGCRLAWRKDPSSVRFLRLHRARRSSDPDGYRLAVAEVEAARLAEYRLPRKLGFMLDLLIEDLPSLLAATLKAAPVGWSSGSTLSSVSVPFLLVAASGVDKSTECATLSIFWRELTDARMHPEYNIDKGRDENVGEDGELSWEPLLRAAIERLTHPSASRRQALSGAREAAMRRIEAIVSGGHRDAYGRVAQLAVAVGEAMSALGDAPETTRWLAGVRASFPRHSAFKRELEAAMRRSDKVKV